MSTKGFSVFGNFKIRDLPALHVHMSMLSITEEMEKAGSKD